jgi:hypothetical protein
MSGSGKKRKGVAKKNDTQESNNIDDDDDSTMTTVFPTLRIKQMLYRDPKVARIEAGGLELINTTSALFMQKIMNQIPKTKTAPVTLQDIRNVFQQDPTFSFLQSTVDEMNNNEADTLRPYVPAKKRADKKLQKPKPAGVTSKTESVQEAMSIAAKTIAGPTTITAQEIVEDDDYYD